MLKQSDIPLEKKSLIKVDHRNKYKMWTLGVKLKKLMFDID